MFINKSKEGKNNVCGEQISKIRKNMKISQRKLADRLQIAGLDVDKNAVQRMESGQRFITDIEMVYLAKVLNCSFEDLLGLKAGDELWNIFNSLIKSKKTAFCRLFTKLEKWFIKTRKNLMKKQTLNLIYNYIVSPFVVWRLKEKYKLSEKTFHKIFSWHPKTYIK